VPSGSTTVLVAPVPSSATVRTGFGVVVAAVDVGVCAAMISVAVDEAVASGTSE